MGAVAAVGAVNVGLPQADSDKAEVNKLRGVQRMREIAEPAENDRGNQNGKLKSLNPTAD